MASLRDHIFSRFRQPASAELALAPAGDAAPPAPAPAPRVHWSPERIAAAESIWGEGFLGPVGAAETVRLVGPFGLNAATTLLLLGAGSGGPSCTLATACGTWVAGFEADPQLATLAAARAARAGLRKRAAIETWDPASPAFRPGAYHHALALDALRGTSPGPVIGALARALRPGGQAALVDVVADATFDPEEAMAARWMQLERRRVPPPLQAVVSGLLAADGFEVRVAEDLSTAHAALVLGGWHAAVTGMGAARPGAGRAAALVEEAELWLLRLRLLRAGRLRHLRWHAIRGSA